MSRILYGAPVAERIKEDLKGRIAALKAGGVEPCLALVRVGEEAMSLRYEQATLHSCEAMGITAQSIVLPAESETEKLTAALQTVNGDPAIHGCLLMRPLPRQIDEAKAFAVLRPEKDMDGIGDASLRRLFSGHGPGFAPCTPEAVVAMLDAYGIPLDGAHAAVIGRSLVVGRPLALLLTARNATVTLCHTHTADLAETCRRADILITAAGAAELVGADFVREGQVILDVGTNRNGEGKLCGDVCFAEVEPLAAAISPVPRGVGAVTTAILLRHVVEAAEALS